MKKIISEIGAEPIYTNVADKSEQSVLIGAFNWYNYNCSKKDAKEFILGYIKFVGRSKNEILAIRSVSESKINLQFGWLARMLCLGFVPSDKTKQYIASKYKELLIEANKDLRTVKVVTEDAPKVNIQDRIREKASEEAGEIEGLIDEFTTGGCKNFIDMNSYFKSRNLSSVVMKKICDVFIERAKEIEEVINTTDSDLKEGYSNFTKPELRRFKEFLDSIVVAANVGVERNKPIRKKRRVKEKPAAILVSKMNYMEAFPDLGLTSVSPEKVVGALQVWIYNTKTKTLGVYNADNAKGLTVKGSTFKNFNEQTSIGKRLRKPSETIKELMEAGKVKIKKILPDLSTKESNLTGRMNSDTIILKIVN